MANINDFKARLAGGGARANQFRVILTPPAGVAAAINPENFSFLCRAASLPGQTIGEVTVPFRGRTLYVAGEREFEAWTSTVLNDTDFAIRREIERWMNGINETVQNTGATNPSDYRTEMLIQQLDRDDTILHQYILQGCWPQSLGAIELSYDTNDAIEEFEITWRYDTFTVSGIN
jgi:hypothetical protein